MEKLVIKGGKRLNGSINVSGAKNASLPILAATILAEGEYYLENIPKLKDIATMFKLLSNFGITSKQIDNNAAILNVEDTSLHTAPYELVKTMRASILALGPLLAKKGKAKVSLPGGCAIGERPVDLHIKALKLMGAEIAIEHGYIEASCSKLKGAEIYFDTVTVTGTENILMAAVLAEGTTVLKNAACEPEIVDLANFLKLMGAKIDGEGTKTITIHGVEQLKAVNYSVMSDRIEAGTLICAVAMAGGEVLLENVPVAYMTSTFGKLRETGLFIDIIDDKTIKVIGNGKIKAVDIVTAEHPGFPTDMQAQFMALMTLSDGVSVITENIFENRFMHVAELKRMGANITLKDRAAIVRGTSSLNGADVMASDLRASASLVIAGLVAEDITEVHRIYHLDRGYEAFEKKLAALGAEIERVKDE